MTLTLYSAHVVALAVTDGNFNVIAASARAEVQDAVVSAFGDSPAERLLRRIVQRGYLDPSGSHELAADELHVSRATYFRRLRTASQRVADYLIAKHA